MAKLCFGEKVEKCESILSREEIYLLYAELAFFVVAIFLLCNMSKRKWIDFVGRQLDEAIIQDKLTNFLWRNVNEPFRV